MQADCSRTGPVHCNGSTGLTWHTINLHSATRHLVTDGLFAYSHNLIYLAQTPLYGGLTALGDAPFVLLLLPALLGLMQRGVIEREEANLAHRFGPAYAAYRDRIRRWL